MSHQRRHYLCKMQHSLGMYPAHSIWDLILWHEKVRVCKSSTQWWLVRHTLNSFWPSRVMLKDHSSSVVLGLTQADNLHSSSTRLPIANTMARQQTQRARWRQDRQNMLARPPAPHGSQPQTFPTLPEGVHWMVLPDNGNTIFDANVAASSSHNDRSGLDRNSIYSTHTNARGCWLTSPRSLKCE